MARRPVEAHWWVAAAYFADGTIEDACPPLQALLHIMAHGDYKGKNAADPAIRPLFTREALLASDWYQERLAIKQRRDVALWERHTWRLGEFLASPGHGDEARRLGIPARLEHARAASAGGDDRGGSGAPAGAWQAGAARVARGYGGGGGGVNGGVSGSGSGRLAPGASAPAASPSGVRDPYAVANAPSASRPEPEAAAKLRSPPGRVCRGR
jgi:hypothetical protein